MSTPYIVKEKIIISGKYLEHYKFDSGYWVGLPKNCSKIPQKKDKSNAAQESIREDNVKRTRKMIRRLINCNQDLDRFMTLTYNTPVLDLCQSNPIFHNFIKRINRIYPNFKYLCVPEFQKKSGRVHYHLLCNIPYTPKSVIEQIWQNGFCFLRKIDNIDNVGAYVCKYLGKENFDPRYFRQKKFFYSYNLLRPLIVDNLCIIQGYLKALHLDFQIYAKKAFEFKAFTKFLGVIRYSQYILRLNHKGAFE